VECPPGEENERGGREKAIAIATTSSVECLQSDSAKTLRKPDSIAAFP
jgi:hypothetical protein